MRELLLPLLVLFGEVGEVALAGLVVVFDGGESGCVGLSGARLNVVNGEGGEKYDEGVPVPGVQLPLVLAFAVKE